MSSYNPFDKDDDDVEDGINPFDDDGEGKNPFDEDDEEENEESNAVNPFEDVNGAKNVVKRLKEKKESISISEVDVDENDNGNVMSDENGNDKLKKEEKEESAKVVEKFPRLFSDSSFDLGLDGLEYNMNELDTIDFEHLEHDLERFQQEDIVEEALYKEVNLQEYSDSLNKDLDHVCEEAVNDYLNEVNNFASLNENINKCDSILEKMQSILGIFQNNLQGISKEIKVLQNNSYDMNVKLKNRKEVEDNIRLFLNKTALTDELVLNLTNDDVSENYGEYLEMLNDRWKYINENKEDKELNDIVPCETQTAKDLKPELQKLINCSIIKSKNFLLSEFHDMKDGETNSEMIQQKLISNKYILEFLKDNSMETYNEILNQYSQIIGKMYNKIFKSYFNGLLKYKNDIANKFDLLSIDENALKSNKSKIGKEPTLFDVGDRIAIIDNYDESPVLLHVLEAENTSLSLVEIIRTIHKHLIDNSVTEYCFINDYFNTKTTDLFQSIFDKTQRFLLENIDNYVTQSYDILGILLSIIVISKFEEKISKDNLSSLLSNYFTSLNRTLWNRFNMVIDQNIESMNTYKTTEKIDPLQHYVIKRFVTLYSSLLILKPHFNGDTNERIINPLINRMTKEVKNFLNRISKEFPTRQNKSIFLINNYNDILSSLKALNIKFNDAYKDYCDEYEGLLDSEKTAFMDVELSEYFDKLLTFCKDCDNNKIDKSDQGNLQMKIKNIVLDFSKTWKENLDGISSEISNNFPDSGLSSEIVKQVLGQLIMIYSRFQEIIKQIFTRGNPFAKDMISIPTIMYEVKKYTK